MRILGIETSCDETAAAIIEGEDKNSPVRILSSVVSSSLNLHAKTGGIIPEIAAREQIKFIIPVIKQALRESNLYNLSSKVDLPSSIIHPPAIDAIAVTVGPGLIGSLLVGVETAKTLAYVWNKPLIPVNHLYGHIYANFVNSVIPNSFRDLPRDRKEMLKQVQHDKVLFPAIALVVSGGHTDLVLIKNHGNMNLIGGTRDDAAGEAFDKIGRLLNLPYPAGPTIERLAQKGNAKAFKFPRPMIGTDDFDFSFSGLKTAVFREVKTIEQLNNETIEDLCASAQQAIIDVLVKKTIKAAQKYNVKSIILSGGVAANRKLKEDFETSILNLKSLIKLFVPTKSLCTDNAAMIASAAFYNYKEISLSQITANPELYFE